ncbi:MAG: HhH-GPD-type base excision DNA repair protein [Jatrophihabitantaceae bacterium]
MYLASTDAANNLLEHDALALLIGMLLDQQIPMEKAFTSPEVLRERLGGRLDLVEIAEYDVDAFEQIFRQAPALHRFPAAMAKRVQALARMLIENYDADPASAWTGAKSGEDLVNRIATLPGFGAQKAKIFAALLGKQFAVRPRGWRAATGDYGVDGSTRSIADVVDADSRKAVRSFKQQSKATAKALQQP